MEQFLNKIKIKDVINNTEYFVYTEYSPEYSEETKNNSSGKIIEQEANIIIPKSEISDKRSCKWVIIEFYTEDNTYVWGTHDHPVEVIYDKNFYFVTFTCYRQSLNSLFL